MEDDRYTTALILITAEPKGITAINMVAHFDFVDRGIPTIEQFYNGLNFLFAHGLVERQGRKYKRTEAGERVYSSVKQKSEYEAAKAIAMVLEGLPELQPKPGIISNKEAAFAVKAYGRLGCLLIFWPF